MSVRVDLLPSEYRDRERSRRIRALVVAAGVGFLVLLAVLWFVQQGRVDRAQTALDEAEQRRLAVQQELDELREFEQLQQRRDLAVQAVEAAMQGEATVAGILQDVAAIVPTDVALTGVTVDLEDDPETALLGTITGTAETTEEHAPGVERFLIELDQLAVFSNVFVASSTLDDEGITTFTFEAELGPEILTGRYDEGLPEALR